MAIDYFTKWVEVQPFATISVAQVQKFVWKLIYRFGLPQVIITNNGRQFMDRKLVTLYENLGVKHVTSSVEQPQMNGQAEAVNKAIIQEFKK